MELDTQQKDDFLSYWKGCPMIYQDKLVHIHDMKKVSTKYTGYLQAFSIFDDFGNIQVHKKEFILNQLEDLNPYFIPNGYYQLEPTKAYWISRRPERIMKKGMCGENMDVYGIHKIKEGSSKVDFYNGRFRLDDMARIYYKVLPNVKPDFSNRAEVSFALSKNIALVASEHEIPIVMYKLNPVGYMDDGKIFVSRDRECSRDLIEEETKMLTELY